MTAEDFKLWRQRLNWTQARAADELGITRVAVAKIESGENPAQRRTALACMLLEQWETGTAATDDRG